MPNYVELGTVVGSSGDSYTVDWDENSGGVYCKGWGWSSSAKYIGKASSPREAMQKAEAWAVQNQMIPNFLSNSNSTNKLKEKV